MTTVKQLLDTMDYEDLFRFDKENPTLSKIIEDIAFNYDIAWQDAYSIIRDFLRKCCYGEGKGEYTEKRQNRNSRNKQKVNK